MTTGAPQMEGPAGKAPPRPGRFEPLANRLAERIRRLHVAGRRWKSRAPRVLAFARTAFYPCALALVGYMGYEAARQTELSRLHYWPLAAAFAAAVVWWVALALGWASLVGGGSRAAAVASWCKTQVARYMPGGVWQILARASTVEGKVRDKVTAVTAEQVIVLLVALAVGGLWASIHAWQWVPLVALVAASLLASRWLERRTNITRRAVRRTAAVYAVAYLAYGVMGVLVQVAVSGVRDPTYPLYVAGAACVAWAVGLVVVIAPGGVGVRELVYVWMLSGLYPRAELAAAAVTSRLVTVLAELVVLAVVSRPRRSRRAQGTPAGPEDPSRSSGSAVLSQPLSKDSVRHEDSRSRG